MNKQCAKLALGRLYGATAFLLQVPLALLAPLAEVINAIGAVALLGRCPSGTIRSRGLLQGPLASGTAAPI